MRRCGSAAGWVSADATAAVARRETPLHLAAESRNADVAAALIGAGADVTVKNIDGYAALRAALRRMADRHSRSPVARRRTAEQHWLAPTPTIFEFYGDIFRSVGSVLKTVYVDRSSKPLSIPAIQEARRNERIAAYAAAVEKVWVAARLAITTTSPSVRARRARSAAVIGTLRAPV